MDLAAAAAAAAAAAVIFGWRSVGRSCLTPPQSTFNHLVDAVLYTPMMKARYFTALSKVFAAYSESGWLEAQVHEIAGLIGADARADVALWNTTKWGFDDSVQRLLSQISVRRGSLAAQLKAVNETKATTTTR